MKDYPAFLFLIKTNLNKMIGIFIDEKYESTKEMKNKIDGKTYLRWK